MNLLEIVNENLNSEETYVLEEGFLLNPIIAAMAFKDSFVEKIGKVAKSANKKVTDAVGNVAIAKEKVKAKVKGRSGNKDDDTVYDLTKEQKKVLSYIYRKYGIEFVKEIEKFRDDIMVPYSIIKRNVSKNRVTTNKEVFGMTKEEYYKYRESGRKKIEKKGTYFKDSDDLKKKQADARNALNNARKKYEEFKEGKIIDLTSTNIEKIFDEAGIGRKELNGWPDSELEKTYTSIKHYMELLKDPKRIENGEIRVKGRKGSVTRATQSVEQIEKTITNLREHGYSNVNNIKMDEKGGHHGSFKDAFAVYMLRREKEKEMRSSSSVSLYKSFYEKVLKDAINAAQNIYDEKFNNYMSLKGTVELNKYEKKIWGLKPTGVEHSGDINDWYLKIKPEQFFETEYNKKSEEIIKAEKDMDKELKKLERKLKKAMSDEDIALCRKYRLFNNFLTVKELKNPSAMFKDASDIKKLSASPVKASNDVEFRNMLDSALSKDFNSIKDLEDEQRKIKSAAEGLKLNSEDKAKIAEFERRINPKNGSKATKVDRNKINYIVDKIEKTVYTGKTQAAEDLKELESTINDFIEVNGKDEIEQFEFAISKAKGKLVSFIQSKGEE